MMKKITSFKYDGMDRIDNGENVKIKYKGQTIIVSYGEEYKNYHLLWKEKSQIVTIECRDKVCLYIQNCLGVSELEWEKQ